jgi:hypothetical protein
MARVNYDYVWLMGQTAAKLLLRSPIRSPSFVWLSFGNPQTTNADRNLDPIRARLRRTSVSFDLFHSNRRQGRLV